MKLFAKQGRMFGKLSSAFVVLEMVFFSVYPALAVRIPTANQMATDLENRYHMSTGSIQNFGENLNVESTKPNVPQLSVFFSPTDPKPGTKITAKALPMFFNSPTEQMYYTWYLKRKECPIAIGARLAHPGDAFTVNGVSYRVQPSCDADYDGTITVNDWKVAAQRIIAQGGFDPSDVGAVTTGSGKDRVVEKGSGGDFYGASEDTDDDAYNAHMGGGTESSNDAAWCYVYDSAEGKTYELAKNGSVFSCGANRVPVCVSQLSGNISSGALAVDPWTGLSSGNAFTEGAAIDSYTIASTPMCSDNVNNNNAWADTVTCPSGTISACISADNSGPFTAAELNSAGAVRCTYASGFARNCEHLFPKPRNSNRCYFTNKKDGESAASGDGCFDATEEKFWGTNPKDPSTADNGNKDEANVVGLGQDGFTWNYQSGDQVGVVVEGVSMLPTKHDDSSNMIMFAFSKNECKITGKSAYVSFIKGYNVTIPTSNMTRADIDGCLPGNLIDPAEGDQAKKIEVTVTATPDNPVNDATEESGGDILSVRADVNNAARPITDDVFTWTVKASRQMDGGWNDITSDLQRAGLLSSAKGNGLSSISVALNMRPGTAAVPEILKKYGLEGDPIYFQVAVKVDENFQSGTLRSGKSDVIVRISNTSKKIVAYSTTVPGENSFPPDYRVNNFGDPICDKPLGSYSDKLDRIVCRVSKNEIIGLEVAPLASGEFANFQWLINGVPLPCSSEVVSAACSSGGVQNEKAFFAVAGNPGDTYTIQLNASDAKTGKSVTLSRTFQVVDPMVEIVPTDTANVWPIYLGEYQSLDGKTSYSDFSKNNFEVAVGNPLSFKLEFTPTFLGLNSSRTWTVDGTVVPENPVGPGADGLLGTTDDVYSISYVPPVPKAVGESYSVGVNVTMTQPAGKRLALETIWGITGLQSQEVKFSASVQATVVEPDDVAAASGPKKFFAAVSQYLPSSIAFAFRLMLTIALLIFTMGFVFALVPETNAGETEEVILSKRE